LAICTLFRTPDLGDAVRVLPALPTITRAECQHAKPDYLQWIFAKHENQSGENDKCNASAT